MKRSDQPSSHSRPSAVPGRTGSADAQTTDTPGEETPGQATSYPVFQFEDLSGGANCIHLTLKGEVYTLRRTQAGKLILNK